MVKLCISSLGVAIATVIVPVKVTGVPEIPLVTTEKETSAVGVPEIVIVLAVVSFVALIPAAFNSVNSGTLASVASPPQVKTIVIMALPLATV